MTDNPYVGPRPFGTDQRALFFGRDREVRELADLLVAERVVLMHAPSGAGKTSLIQAGLIPAVAGEFDVLPVVRVGHPAPPGARNRYQASALVSLGAAAADATLTDHLAARPPTARPQLVVFDQFEEMLTLDPYDLGAKDAFVADLAAALRRDRTSPDAPRRWALFAVRDEFVAALSPYLTRLPTGLGQAFRLDLLGKEAALDAVRRPAADRGVRFDPGAANLLVDNLRRVRGKAPDEPGPLGPYVEPVQLQVVCYRMWEKLREEAVGPPAGDEAGRAEQARVWAGRLAAADEAGAAKPVKVVPDHVGKGSLADVDLALAEYYAERVRRAADRGKTSERTVRAWVANYLITPAGFRAAVQIGSGLGRDPAPEVLDELDDAHLIRRDERLGQVWVQLSHDRLLDPIRANNRRWMEEKLVPFQLQALQWEGQGEPKRLLLTGTARREAEVWAGRYPDRLDPTDQKFLDASGGWVATTRWERVRRHFYRNRGGWLAAAVAATIFGFAVDASWKNWEANRALCYADRARDEADRARDQAEENLKRAEAAERLTEQLIAQLDLESAQKRTEKVSDWVKGVPPKPAPPKKTYGPPESFGTRLTDEEKLATEQAGRRRARPVEPGVSVSAPDGTAGTTGCFVRDASGTVFLLTLDHALRAEGVRVGDAVIQPGRLDRGDTARDRIGTVTRVLPTRFDAPNPTAGALVALDPGVGIHPQLLPGKSVVPGDAVVGDKVVLLGRTSALTRGTVTAVGATARITYGTKPPRVAEFRDLIAVTGADGRFAMPGDSGGPVVTPDGRLVGLLHAGSESVSYVLPIKPMLAALGVELVTDLPKKN